MDLTGEERTLAVEALRELSQETGVRAADRTAARIEADRTLTGHDWRLVCEALHNQLDKAVHDEASEQLLQKAREAQKTAKNWVDLGL